MQINRQDFSVYLGYLGYAGGTAVIPMLLLPMGEEIGFSLSAGGGLHLVRSIIMVVAMMVSGNLACRLGKGRVLSLSLLLMGGGLFLCSGSSVYATLVCALLLLGFGGGLFESLATGYVHSLHEGKETGRYINITHSFWPLGTLVTVLFAGMWMARWNHWRLLLACGGFLLLVFSFFFFQCSRFPSEGAGEKVPPAQFFLPLKRLRFWLILCALFLASGSEHCLTFWTPSYVALELNGSGMFSGGGVALFSVGMFLGRLLGGLLGGAHSGRLIGACALLGAVLSAFLPLLFSPLPYLCLLFLAGMTIGPLWPTLQCHCASTLKMHSSTILYILMPLFGIPGCGILTYLLGLFGEHLGMRRAFFLVPLCNVLIVALLAVYNMLQKREAKQ